MISYTRELYLMKSTGPARLDEVFFDSQVWLDSDVEDFYSVNGGKGASIFPLQCICPLNAARSFNQWTVTFVDFTPSCGNTPIHPNSVIQTPERQITDENHDIEPVESPPDGKKRLSELFGDEKHNVNKTNEIVTQESYTKMNGIQQPEPLQRNIESQKSVPGSPYASLTSSICSSTERTPTRGLKSQKYKSGCSSPCCIPGLARSLSFGQKKKTLVPAHV